MMERTREKYLTIEQVMEKLNISRSTVDRITRGEYLKPVSWKGRLWFSTREIDDYVVERGIIHIVHQDSKYDRQEKPEDVWVSGSMK